MDQAPYRPRWLGRATLATGLFVLMLVVSLGPLAPAQAQVGVYTLEGHVHDTDGQPLEGAFVALTPEDGSDTSRNVSTDAEGAYRFDNVSEGRYRMLSGHDCCGLERRVVDVNGTQLTHTVDLELPPKGNGTLVLEGTVHDVETGEPVEGAELRFHNFPTRGSYHEHGNTTHAEEPRKNEEISTTSGPEGDYEVELRPGQVRMLATAPGYAQTHAGFEIEQDRRVDIPLQETGTDAATVQGVVRSDAGHPIEDARLTIRVDRQAACDGDVCREPLPDRRAHHQEVRQDNVTFRIQPQASSHDGTGSDEDGRFTLEIQPGPVILQAWASDHVTEERRFTLDDNETRDVTLTLERIPEDTVMIDGTVIDQETGEPVPYAQVRLENQRWGHTNHTQTGEDGTFNLQTKPGYTTVIVTADQRVHRPCPQPAEANATAVDHEGNTTDTHEGDSGDGDEPREASASRETRPARQGCQPTERDHGYYSNATTFVGEAGETRALDVELAPKNEPDAVLQGWVVNATGQEGIPDAELRLVNEATGQWGRVATDGNGSFRLDVTHGYYTIQIRADGYYRAIENVPVAEGEERTVALELTPGQARHGRCCVVYDGAAEPYEPHRSTAATGDAGGMDADDGRAVETGASAADQDLQAQASFESSGGGLGVYDAGRVGAGDDRAVPGPGLMVVLAAVVGAGSLVRGSRR